MGGVVERLGPTVDLYVQTLIDENERLRHQRDRARKSAWEARQARDRWKREALELRPRTKKQALYDYRYRQRLKAAA